MSETEMVEQERPQSALDLLRSVKNEGPRTLTPLQARRVLDWVAQMESRAHQRGSERDMARAALREAQEQVKALRSDLTPRTRAQYEQQADKLRAQVASEERRAVVAEMAGAELAELRRKAQRALLAMLDDGLDLHSGACARRPACTCEARHLLEAVGVKEGE